MVYLYAVDISALPDPAENPTVIQKLPRERQKKILNYKQKRNRLQGLGAGLLLEKVFCQYGVATETIYTDTNGKPTAEGICFNLAHSGQYVICAVSNRKVGCDIEQLRDAPVLVAERSFSEKEKAYLMQFSGDVYNREFFRIWTKKESYLKMIGTGLRASLNTLEVKDCHINEYDIPGYQVTVCAEESTFAELEWKKL